jgi:hypothetical protein
VRGQDALAALEEVFLLAKQYMVRHRLERGGGVWGARLAGHRACFGD